LPVRSVSFVQATKPTQANVDAVGDAPVPQQAKAGSQVEGCALPGSDRRGDSFIWTDEPWVDSPNEFSSPVGDEDLPAAASGFLGKAVGTVHENQEYWEQTFEANSYVSLILKNGYKIPVRMSAAQRITRYREKNNQSARNEMDFVRSEVARLLKDGQIVECKSPPRCTNPLSVAFKVNADGSIKRRLVIDLSRWVNGFITPDRFKMARFQDAIAHSLKGDFQSVFDISKAYHHLLLSPESYNLVGWEGEILLLRGRSIWFRACRSVTRPSNETHVGISRVHRDSQHHVRRRWSYVRGDQEEGRRGLRHHDQGI
jgi:hypothetical protein